MANELGPIGPIGPTDAVAQLSFLVQGMLERRAGEHGVSLIQARLLAILRDRKPTINELAQLLGIDKSSTSGLVDRAERRQLVRRLPSQVDRRSVRVSITADGRALVAELMSRFEADIDALLEPLAGAERPALTELLTRLLDARGHPPEGAGTPEARR